MARILLLLNPNAGQAQAGALLGNIQSYTDRHPDIDLVLTQGPGDAQKLARQAALHDYDVVAAAGGDGTIHEVVNGLMSGSRKPSDRPKLGIIPIGSANDLARGLGLDLNLECSLKRIRNGRSRAIDIGYICDRSGRSRYFTFSTGIGYVGAVAAERFRVRHAHGPLLYLWAGLRALRYYEPNCPLQIKMDNEPMRSHHLMFLSINNVGSVGGFPLTPEAEVDDGLFDVLSVQYVGRARRVWLLMLAWAGQHFRAPEFNLSRSNRLEIICEKAAPVHVDGEIFGGCQNAHNHITIDLIPKALQVLV